MLLIIVKFYPFFACKSVSSVVGKLKRLSNHRGETPQNDYLVDLLLSVVGTDVAVLIVSATE